MAPTSPRCWYKRKCEQNKKIISQVLAAHAVIGCDTTAMSYGIGKGTVIKVLQSEIVMSHIDDPNASMDAVIKDATNFIGSCYGYSNESCMSWLQV